MLKQLSSKALLIPKRMSNNSLYSTIHEQPLMSNKALDTSLNFEPSSVAEEQIDSAVQKKPEPESKPISAARRYSITESRAKVERERPAEKPSPLG